MEACDGAIRGKNEDDTRHAGTSADGDRLGEIQMDAGYEGIWRRRGHRVTVA